MRKHLAFLLTRQIGAGRWSGQVELGGVAGMLGHGGLKPSRFNYNVASVLLNSEARIGDTASTCELRNRDICLRPLGSPAERLSSNPLFDHRFHWRNACARFGLLMTTVPTSMSCRSRFLPLKKATSRIKGVRNATVT